MDQGDFLTRWSVRCALTLAVLAVLVSWRWRHSVQGQAAGRALWTLGCLAFLVHVGCAFHFYHHWSHTAAYEETARRTAELFGLYWGGGLFGNYAFTLVWVLDVAWWWRGLAVYRARPRWITGAILGFFAFMAFNATVVFASGPVRWVGLGVSAIVAVGWYRYRPRDVSG